MKSWSLLILLLLTILVGLNAQTNWRKGVIVKNDGTELMGEVNDKEWTVNPKKIEFRGEDGTISIFTTHQLKNFSTSRPSRYEVFPVEYDGENQNVNGLSTYRNPVTLSRDTVFLQVVVRATLGLFKFVDSNGRTHFFTNLEGGVVELLNRRYKDPATKTLMGVNEKFKQQLLLRAGNCNDLQTTLKQLKYHEETLRSKLIKMNKCNGNQIEEIWEGETFTKRNEIGIAVQFFLAALNFHL